MMTPSRGRHGSGSRKHATSGTDHRRPHTESHVAGPERAPRAEGRKALVASAGAWAKAISGRLPRARVLLLGAGAVLLVASVVVTAMVLLPSRTVRVPDLVGIPRAQAAERVTALGLVLNVRDTGYSPTIAKDSVAAQEPTAGLLVSPGSTVIIDLSAGSESFALPDVIGQDLDTARGALRARGLTVTFTTAISTADSGTVIASAPEAGTPVLTGDTVRLTLATSVGAVSASDLTGVTIVLDPAPPNAGDASDASMDAAIRLSALLSAAGATVTMTRESGVTSPAVTPADRVRIAKETSATALVGFSVMPSSLEGMVLLTMQPSSASDQVGTAAGPLADAVFASLRVDMSAISTLTAAGDAVLSGSGLPGVRVRLGSFASESDAKSFADERWLEVLANDIYRALAQLYGRQ